MLKILQSNSLRGKRKENQDAILIKEFDDALLLAVADGIGGKAFGKEVAKIAINALNRSFKRKVEFNPIRKMRDSFFKANRDINRFLENLEEGGTTLTAVYYQDGRIYYVNVGDSRVWVCRDKEMINITIDQNLYEKKRLANLNPQREDKRLIFRALGVHSNVKIDEVFNSNKWSAIGEFELQKGDILIVSTDGFHDFIKTNSICKKIEESFEDILKEIEVNSYDNITFIVAKEV